MMKKEIQLLEVDQVNVTIVMDNTIDAHLAGSDIAHRFDFSRRPLISEDGFSSLVAEHEFSNRVQVKRGSKQAL